MTTSLTSPSFKSHCKTQYPTNHGRVMEVTTPHGTFQTPAFMPVGTRAVVNHMTAQDLRDSGSQIILGGNTYHMLCKPGLDIIEAAGGMHPFMGWHGPMLTDSGGFQVFSLSKQGKLCTIDDKGAHFKHPETGKILPLTPETSIWAQKVIGADIIMAFDECTPEVGGREVALKALDRTHRWLLESKEAHAKHPTSVYGHGQALFGIIQGGSFQDLREQSTQAILDADLDGIAIGGEVVGFDMAKTMEIIDWVRPHLPKDKLRYTMGVGLNPQDLIDVVARGIDVFDCVAPTRNARHGGLYHGITVPEGDWVRVDTKGEEKGKIAIKKSQYATDDNPILAGCECFTCTHHTRAYLHYLYKEKSPSYGHFASIHNVHVMHQTCEAMRKAMV